MTKKVTHFTVSLISIFFLSTAGFSQIRLELTGFGKFNMNLGFSKDVSTNPTYASDFREYYPEWQPFFFDPVLEEKSGIGFGGRIALELTPQIGIEGSIEYVMSEFRFNKEDLDAVKAKMSSIGYSPYFFWKDSGGNIMRYYGNVVFNLPTEGEMLPYITLGIGVTQFTMGPSITGDRPSLLERMDIYYDDVSALTFNGGFGLKYFLAENMGVRFDFRVFYCSPEFKQTYGYKVAGVTFIPEGNWVSQKGSHLDASVNVGVFIKI